MNKSKIINYVLWIALILAMAASIQHLAWTFGTVELMGMEWLGWIPAVAVDAGLAALAYTIQQRKRADRPVFILWCGVIGFASVSAAANFYHALAVEGFALSAGPIMIAKAVVLSATLPVAYIFLGEIISGDDAAVADELKARAEREQKKAEREQNRLEKQAETERLQAERLLLEAQTRAKSSEPPAAEKYIHATCGRSFSSQNALNAHIPRCRASDNGKNADPVETWDTEPKGD